MNVLYYIINTDIEPDLPKGAIRRILPSGRASRSIPAALSSGGNPGAVDNQAFASKCPAVAAFASSSSRTKSKISLVLKG
mmetsp:Transcript_50879/g.100712  ORF Transcript_50879/g.100712 Transcript_50879/m.100712 type:complete len:80 (+) Transcript_50879:266-505(+)